MSYIPTLDGWRTIAIFLVIICHASDSIDNAVELESGNFVFLLLKDTGLLGVQIFFSLSGFLITTKIINEEINFGRLSLKLFYIRRAFRILPAAIVFLSALYALSFNGIIQISFGRIISSLFFFANYTTAAGSWYAGHFWSLAVEEHFYFLWPLLFIILKTNNRRIHFAIAGALLIALWRAVDWKFHFTSSSPAVFWGRTDIQADMLISGCLVALLYSNPIWQQRLSKLLSCQFIWYILVALVVAMAIFSHSLDWKITFLLITIKAVAIPLVILGTVTHSTKLPGRILETGLFRWIGRLSYSLYLWQQIFLVWNPELAPSISVLQSWPFNIIASFSCAIVSMILIERPFITLGHRLANNSIQCNP